MSTLFTKDDGSSMIIAVSKLLEATPGFQSSMEAHSARILFIELREFDLHQHDLYIVPEETKKALIHRELNRVLNSKYAILRRIVKVSWLSNCIEQQKLLQVDAFRVFTSMEPQYIEQPSRRREYFSLEDEKLLVDYVHKANVPNSGLNMYKELARKYPQHTAESWREHYKIIKKVLPPIEDGNLTGPQSRTVRIVPSQSIKKVSSGFPDPEVQSTPTKTPHIHHYPFPLQHRVPSKKRSYYPLEGTTPSSSNKRVSSSLSYTKTDLKLLEYYLFSYGKEKSLDDICWILNESYSNIHAFIDWKLLYKYFYPHLNFESPAPALAHLESKTQGVSLENLDVDDQMIEEKFLDHASFTSDTISIQEAISPKSLKKPNLTNFQIPRARTVDQPTKNSGDFSSFLESPSIPMSVQESPSRILETPIKKPLSSFPKSYGKLFNEQGIISRVSTNSPTSSNTFPAELSSTLREGNVFVRPNEDLAIPPLDLNSDSESIPYADSEVDDDAEFEKQVMTTYSSSPVKAETKKVNDNRAAYREATPVSSPHTSDSRSFVDRSSTPPESPAGGNQDGETSNNLLLDRNRYKKLDHGPASHSKSSAGDYDTTKDATFSNERGNSSFSSLSSLRNTSLFSAESPNLSPTKISPLRHEKKSFSDVLRELHDYLVTIESSSDKKEIDEAIDMILQYTQSSEQQFLDVLESTEGNISAAIARLLIWS
ncbi:shelterin complex telomere binding subunit Rap1 [Schizosaccharomyces osmophilus]|uniref:Shelterin complex telomere binding subunit Rap1 n=1 Tax=Schizosaccharomyces osmophilus TaxID=2545709 RepID=A0AAE9WCB5_9SCHI|nr:shelterin complex telomere binding subunit Rap1 [Schizosaccharomyces osmophilus]WBW72984.1 shelterin complex telomere binding subunit Rap1 [Schizosaccharomyces osmophilus]